MPAEVIKFHQHWGEVTVVGPWTDGKTMVKAKDTSLHVVTTDWLTDEPSPFAEKPAAE